MTEEVAGRSSGQDVSHGAPYACEDEAREALAAAAADLGATLGTPGAGGPATLSLRWRRSGAEGFLVVSLFVWQPAPGKEQVDWTRLEQGPAEEPPDWRLHRDLYRHRADVGAVVNSRPAFSTTLACIAAVEREGIPAFHPDVVAAAGGAIRCARRAPSSSAALARHVLEALEDRSACLLAGRGLLAVGSTLRAARGRSIEIESLSRIYCSLLQCAGKSAP